jgi:hypothetical protein
VECDHGTNGGKPIYWAHGSVNSVAFSPDGNRIVSGSDDALFVCGMRPRDKWREAHLLGTRIRSILSHSLQMGTGSSLARMMHYSCVECDHGTNGGKPIYWAHEFGQFCRILSRWEPDRLWLGDRTIRVWNATTGQMEGSPFTGHTNSVNSVAFSPDGNRIVSGSDDGTIRLWNFPRRSSPHQVSSDWLCPRR